MKVLVSQSCPTLWDLLHYSPPGSSVHGILQARILEWVAIPFSRGSSRPKDQTQVSCIAGRFLTIWATREALPTPPQKKKNGGFSGGSDGKESACNAGDAGSIPGSGRSPGKGNGCLLQYCLEYSCLENPMDRGAWWATVHRVPKVGHDWVTKHTHTY